MLLGGGDGGDGDGWWCGCSRVAVEDQLVVVVADVQLMVMEADV